MGFLKKFVTTVAVAVDGCAECGPNPGGVSGGCQCDFLDEMSPTTADDQRKLDRIK